MSSSRDIPSLDGLRAIAVSTVIGGHLLNRAIGERDGVLVKLVGPVAFWGVGLFFAISGFLITRLLLAERARTGHLALGRFYGRRAVRLWPPLWVFLAAMATLAAFDVLHVTARDVAASIFFVSDYVLAENDTTLHTWSLSVEEQFYLLWPAVLLWAGYRRAWRWVAVAIAAGPLVRLASYALVPDWRGSVSYQFHQLYDVLAFGCLLALLWDNEQVRSFVQHRAPMLMAGGLFTLLVTNVGGVFAGAPFELLLGITLQSAAFTAIVAGAVASAPRVLNVRPVRHVGVISYSLYLWQQPFTLDRLGPFANPALGVLATVVVAELSYFLIERPCEPLRRRLNPVMPQETAH